MDVCIDVWEGDGGRVAERCLWNLSGEIIENFGEQRESRSNRVFLISDDDGCGIIISGKNERCQQAPNQQVVRDLHDCRHERRGSAPALSGAVLVAFVR